MNYNPKVVSFDRSSAYVHHRAMINRRENNPVDALELMRHAVERSPENQEYRLDLAELYCEMGCHEQSSRLLLDMLAGSDAPAECYYGLALNQLSMNDLEGAQHSLRMYRRADPNGAHVQEVRRLSEELDIYDALNRPASRRLYRAMKVADRACDMLQEGNLVSAKRLFERSLSLASEQFEMRALYAMTLMMDGEDDAALREANRAADGFPPSARAMCVAAQVFHALGKEERAAALLRQVIDEHPTGADLRLLIFSLSEMSMHAEIAECARIALQETPYDRQLLHIRAVALHNTGTPDRQVERFWLRILRIDPDDSIAGYYQNACARGVLKDPEYTYQVPEEEYERRFAWLSEKVNGGLNCVREAWNDDPAFRQLIRWAATTDDGRLRRVAVTVIAAMDDEEAQSSIRALMFSQELQPELKLHAAALLKLRGADLRSLLPGSPEASGMLPDSDALLEDFMVGERQLLRYANEVLERDYDVSALAPLTMMWAVYRQHRGMRADPLVHSEAVSAALVYLYLTQQKIKVTLGQVAQRFGCSLRRLTYYAGRIAGVLERLEGDTQDENP